MMADLDLDVIEACARSTLASGGPPRSIEKKEAAETLAIVAEVRRLREENDELRANPLRLALETAALDAARGAGWREERERVIAYLRDRRLHPSWSAILASEAIAAGAHWGEPK